MRTRAKARTNRLAGRLPGGQAGRLLELPILGAVLVVLGAWLGGKYHPAGFILSLIPILIWAGLSAARLALRVGRAWRLRGAIRAQLRGLLAQGFDAQLLLKGDLGWGDAWAAFDFARGEIAVLRESGMTRHALGQLKEVFVGDGARRLGDTNPHYYTLELGFAPPGEARAISIAARRRGTAQAWAERVTQRLDSGASATRIR